MKTVIRAERVEDYGAIAEVNRLAFGQENEARLVEAIRNAPGFNPKLSLVAIRNDRVVGHILFSPIVIESGQVSHPALALAPMAVVPDFQRQGIGSGLVNAVLEECGSLGHIIVVVLGHPEYYPRFGFERASAFDIQAPFDVPDEALMVLALTTGGLDGSGGVVRYPDAFGGV